MPSLSNPVASHARHRSHSDPFSDPNSIPQAPTPPPKYSAPRQSASRSRPTTAPKLRDNIMDAVKDTVIVRSSDHPSRARPSRSQTGVPPSHSSPASRPPAGPARRSHSDDSVPQTASTEKARTTGRSKPPKKGSVHADVIDRLDFSGVGPMFHHDGPFDACAPSRNRTRTKAPMYAWTGINPEDEQLAARYRNERQGPAVSPAYDSPYISPNLASVTPASPYYPEPPKKQVDAIAEAWGIHEPEPYEEFFAGGGTRDGEDKLTYGRSSRRPKDASRESEEARRSNKRSTLPPPQPIFVAADALPDTEAYPPSPLSGASPGMKRNKSFLQRIRNMRDAPNVPVGYDEVSATNAGNGQPSPTSSMESTGGGGQYARPTHRSQNSFLGRFGGRNIRENQTPTSEAYVYVEDPKMKDLPATPDSPRGENDRGYFDHGGSGPTVSPGQGGGLGRKTSLLKKVKGVVRGAK
ncbi:hypothetical protein EW146_g1079 [Bondarzewia mesenterica]|uniref:Pal1 cell morphology protein n=1 Tax=Bondarzewia mesenterica TaxID=1095465 RepID=A0A4S4M5F1_9AGAM|nr:hypothetical protein EW146_g1079 [Bondarzewia mesenterica]